MTPQEIIADIDAQTAKMERETDRPTRIQKWMRIAIPVFSLTVWPCLVIFGLPALRHVHRPATTNTLWYLWFVAGYVGSMVTLNVLQKVVKKYNFVVIEWQSVTNPGMYGVMSEGIVNGVDLLNIPLHPIEHVEGKMKEFGAKLNKKHGYYTANKKQATLIRLNLQ